VTSDSDFLTSNRGYGIVEDTSVSAGNIRRTLGLPNFGLANANPTVTGWQSTTSFATKLSDLAFLASLREKCVFATRSRLQPSASDLVG
jgi:hypothetical protein